MQRIVESYLMFKLVDDHDGLLQLHSAVYNAVT